MGGPVHVPYRNAPGFNAKKPWLQLYFAGLRIPLLGLVDSGSDSSSFPLDLGVALGLTYDTTSPVQGLGVSGDFQFYVATNELVAQSDVGQIVFRRALLVPGGARHILLGRNDFFRQYRVKFSEREERMELEPYLGASAH